MTFNGYFQASGNQGQSRVLHSPDCGVTWYDATNNLPPFPVNCIAYQNGSNDVLYIGTDVGVFQFSTANTTPGVGTWNCFNQGLPVVAVMTLDLNYCKSKIRAATYGRGIYVSDMPVTTDFVINTPTTWYGNHYVPGDIFITGGATLNLYGTIYMGGGKRIKVDRGAELNVHPTGQLTNGCGDMWQGVEVYGTSASAQNLAGAQGVIVMQSGSSLSNALEGISSAQMSGGAPVSGYTGGVIECVGAKFTNNRRDAAMYSYHWLISGHEQPNLSYFKNCAFQTTAGLNDPAQLLSPHLTLNDVFKPSIYGCQFTNTANYSIYSGNFRGTGISTVDASYTIDNYYGNLNPPSLISGTYFYGMLSGIIANFTNPAGKQVMVKNATFNGMFRCVQISNAINPVVTMNSITGVQPALTTNMVDATYGVDMYNCSGLSVNCNTMTGVYSATSNNYGTIIDNCGSSSTNVVSNNNYTGFIAGVQAQGNNGSGTGGVQFECNTFQSGMNYQMAICPQNTGSIASQGSTCSLGNTRQNNFFVPSSPYKQIIATNAPLTYYASVVNPTVLSGLITINWCSTVSGECSTGCSTGNMTLAETPGAENREAENNFSALSQLSSPERELALTGAYIQAGEVSKAQNLIAGFRQAGMNEAADYFNIELGLANANQSWYEASPSQISRITEIANGNSEVAAYAHAVIQLLNGQSYQHLIEHITPPEESSKTKATEESGLSDNIPNPFQETSVIECQIQPDAKKAVLVISTTLGEVLRNYALNTGDNKVVVDGTSLRPGVYYYSLFVDGQRVATKKMLVIH